MAAPAPMGGGQGQNVGEASSIEQSGPQRPTGALTSTQSTSAAIPQVQGDQIVTGKKRRNHRGGRNKKGRRKSFAVAEDDDGSMNVPRSNRDPLEAATPANARPPFYRLGQSGGRNLSSTSLDSEALLDHRYFLL